MPFDWGASLCINQALLIADIEGFALTTEQDVSHTLLLTKYKMAADNHQQKQEHRVLVKESTEQSSKFASLAINVVNRLLPDSALENRTFQDIIKYRKASEEARRRFLRHIHQLTTEIETDIWEQSFPSSVEKTLRQIDIEAEAYSDSLTEIYEESNLLNDITSICAD